MNSELWREVIEARAAAHLKHGDQSIEVHPADSPRWLPILVEEVGELAHEMCYDGDPSRRRAEAIDCLAVLAAFVDALDRDSELDTEICPGWPDHYRRAHDPGGAWYGQPLDHGRDRKLEARYALSWTWETADRKSNAGWHRSICPRDQHSITGKGCTCNANEFRQWYAHLNIADRP